MKALIIYDSVFGNTEKIATVMGDALGAKILKVTNVQSVDLDGIDLLIVGSPTRAFTAMPSVKNWIKRLPKGSLNGVHVSAFDTRMSLKDVDSKLLNFMASIFGFAAEPMVKSLIKKGGRLAAKPKWFIVTATEGPLKTGELDRVIEWTNEFKKA